MTAGARSLKGLPDGLRVFGVKTISYALGTATAIVLARGLAPGERGIWAVCVLLASLIAILSEFGVGTAATLLLARSDRPMKTVVSSGFALALGLVLVGVVIAGILVSTHGERLFPGVPPRAGLLAALAAPFIVLTGLGRQLALASGRLSVHNRSVVLQAFLLCGFVVAGLAIPGKPLLGLVLLYVIGQALTALATVAGVWVGLPGPPEPDSSLAGPLFRNGLKAYWATVALFLAYRIDVLIVNYFVGPEGAGFYAIALTLSEMLRGIPESAQALVLLRFRHPDLAERGLAVCRSSVIVTLIVGSLVASAGGWLVPLVFGRQYSPAASAFVWLVPGVVALAFSYALSPLLLRAGEIGVSALAATVATVVMISLDIILVPRTGIRGAALSSSIAYATMTAIQIARLRTLGVLDWRALRPRRDSLTALLWWRLPRRPPPGHRLPN